ncbi:xanthine dehydrogenase family protein subunit M [Pseudaminobacter arsenicus]|uniref:Xanthine dehydrogenase family protein subunit M n=1 Tax=Borborobacter arsenicus TaxID=1851146 RepID=A0A432V4G9_9HYPH|nr:xanthine dehydrogenase family protein subunit M [Pseudaminobacter arsenicus]RUM97049.1 xanthine dehydrogenase family protein subunit M [Pseudaminobacter arsenicus]
MIRYAKPTSIEAALALLGEGSWRILAGGTDFYPALGNRPPREDILDINGLGELRGIAETPDQVIIGARTTWTDLICHDLPAAFDGLKLAAREVGSVQIQNMASIAGNLCNASPAADGVPPLLTLDAAVEIRSTASSRFLPLDRFILGNRRTALQPGEMVTAIRIPKPSTAGTSAFFKLGARRYLVISIAMAAARLVIADGIVKQAAIAVGSCSAVAKRLTGVETALRGIAVADIATAIATAELSELAPIDDVRASAGYRREAAREIVTRAVLAAADPPSANAVAA